MGRNKITGLYFRGGTWHIDKQVKGYGRLCESCGTSEKSEAESYLIHKLDTIRQATLYGVRTVRTFREAATKYLLENATMPSIELAAIYFKQLDPFIGDLPLDKIHDGTLRPFISHMQSTNRSNRTINIALQRVIRVLNLASRSWIDEFGHYWLDKVPMIQILQEHPRSPFPISMEQQEEFCSLLPDHLKNMFLFKVNTGTREQEVCQLQWSWRSSERTFVVPWHIVKNRTDRLVILNDLALSIIEQQPRVGNQVFTFKAKGLARMNESAWRNARKRAGIPGFRVHDCKHTFGARLRAEGVSFEDRQVLLGHKNGSVTTHYSRPEIDHLVEMSNRVVPQKSRNQNKKPPEGGFEITLK